jgi:FtsH-binding integral membrane protein
MQTYSYSQTATAEYDLGLRKYLLNVFNYMTLALAISGLVSAFIGTNTDFATAIWGNTVLKWVAMLAPLGISLYIAFAAQNMSSYMANVWLIVFSAAMGVSLSSIFLVFTLGSIAQVFFISAATFGAMALWGYTTKRDLSGFGSFLMMGVIGLIIAGLVNIFLASSVLSFVISALGVLIFTGLTAYDMQTIKNQYDLLYDGEEREKAGVFGALNLYLDFINIFVNLLQLIGDRK